MERNTQYATTSDGVRIAFSTKGHGMPFIEIPAIPFCHGAGPAVAVPWGPSCGSSRLNTVAGFRLAWRLPTLEERRSLIQHFAGPPPLPPGHPFIVKTDDFYWTATSTSETQAAAIRLDNVLGTLASEPKTESTNYAWCVRSSTGAVGLP